MAEKKFGGRVFKVTPLLATDAVVLQARLMKAAGPAIERVGEVLGGMSKDATEETKARANAAAIAAFADIFGRNDPHELAALLKALVETAQIQRPSGYDKVDFDGDFTDAKGDILPVAVWVAKEQFGDFFSGLRGIGNLGKAAAA